MARYAILFSPVGLSVRSESPPPAYSKDPPPYQSHANYPNWAGPDEETPLLNRAAKWRPKTQHLKSGLNICIGIATLVITVVGVGAVAIVLWYLLGAIVGFFKHLWDVLTYTPPIPSYSIAIIGAGPAGISAAQHLHLRAGSQVIRLNITLFEAAPSIGGQLALNDSTGGPVFPHDDHTQDPIIAEDIAGSALVWGNPLFTKTSEALLGDKVEFSELGSQQVSYFSNDHVVVETTRPYSKTPTFSWIGLIFRYGSSVWSAGALARDGTALRDRFVDPSLEPNIMQLMISLGILNPAQESAWNGLNARGIGGGYVTDILSPEVERAHSQKISDTSALATMLAAGREDSANAYIGGELIDRLEQIIGAIGTNVRLSTRVSGIKHEHLNDQKAAWLVEYNTPSSFIPQAEAFDRVIIAAPNFDLYQASSVDDIEAASTLAYRSAHVTFFTLPSRLDPGRFGDVNQVLFLEDQNEDSPYRGIRELAFVRDVIKLEDGEERVEYMYRALSDSDVTKQLQSTLEITWKYQVKLENAYPFIFPSGRFPQFKLSQKGLWWTSAIQTVASTVDMSVLAGKIVAHEIMRDLRK